MVLPALRRCGYTWTEQTCVGSRPGGRKHKVDLVASKDEATVLVSMKWQEASGTAEQKVPFEVMCLADALKEGEYARAYLVLGGPGWTIGFSTYNGLGSPPDITDNGVQVDSIRSLAGPGASFVARNCEVDYAFSGAGQREFRVAFTVASGTPATANCPVRR